MNSLALRAQNQNSIFEAKKNVEHRTLNAELRKNKNYGLWSIDYGHPTIINISISTLLKVYKV
jgi:hypothetical protein